MPQFQYDLSTAQTNMFGRVQLPAREVPVRLNGTTISVIDLHEDGMANLSLTAETVKKLSSGHGGIYPYTLLTGIRGDQQMAELISLDIVA